jgi:hypothetical protein
MLKAASKDLSNMLEAELTKMGLPPDLIKAALEVAEQLPGGISISQQAERVNVTVRTPPSLAKLADQLAPMVKAMLGAPPG